MAESQYLYLALGQSATSFYDMATKLYLTKGKVVKVTRGVLRSKKTNKALSAGHIVQTDEAAFNAYVEKTSVDKLGSKAIHRPENDGEAAKLAQQIQEGIQANIDEYKSLLDSGLSINNITAKFSRGQLLDMAIQMELELESDNSKETKKTLSDKIYESLNSEDDDDEEDEDEEEEENED